MMKPVSNKCLKVVTFKLFYKEVKSKMKMWIIAGIMIGMLLITGIVISSVGLVSADISDEEKTTETISCSSCRNSCTTESNCGRATCGAVSGGSCGC